MIRFILAGLLGAILACAATEVAAEVQPRSGVSSERLELNSASLAQLSRLPGIGDSLARRIVERRIARPFRRRVELLRIPGIGRRTYFRLRHLVRVEPAGARPVRP
jgi:competence protein ComEA